MSWCQICCCSLRQTHPFKPSKIPEHEHRRTYNHGKPKFILDGKEVVASMFEAQQFKALHGQDSTVRTALV